MLKLSEPLEVQSFRVTRGSYFELIADLDENTEGYVVMVDDPDHGWDPIGYYGNPFTGSFNGSSHTIKGLTTIGRSRIPTRQAPSPAPAVWEESSGPTKGRSIDLTRPAPWTAIQMRNETSGVGKLMVERK